MGTEGSLKLPKLEVWRHQSLPYDWESIFEGRSVESKMTDAFVQQIRHSSSVIKGLEGLRRSAEDATTTLGSALVAPESARTGDRVNNALQYINLTVNIE